MVAVDPLASFAPREILVRLGNRDYVIAPRPAIDWLEAILAHRTATILPSFLESGEEEVFAAMMAGDVTDDDLDEATCDAITVASGRAWWWSTQLLLMAAHDNRTWASLHGRMVLAGVDAAKVSLGAFVDALYAAICELHTTGEERQRFDVTVDTPPASVGLDEEEEGAAFLALMSAEGLGAGGDGSDLYP